MSVWTRILDRVGIARVEYVRQDVVTLAEMIEQRDRQIAQLRAAAIQQNAVVASLGGASIGAALNATKFEGNRYVSQQ